MICLIFVLNTPAIEKKGQRKGRREEGIEGRKDKCEVQLIKKDWEMLVEVGAE